jgi:hypothetical protein
MQHEDWLIVMDDCLDALRAMPAESVDVIPTSPLYNIGMDYNRHNDRMPPGIGCTVHCGVQQLLPDLLRESYCDGRNITRFHPLGGP